MDVKKKYGEKEINPGSETQVESEHKSRDMGRIVAGIFTGLLCCGAGYLLGGRALLFGAMPLGIAYLCAADRKVPYIYVGLCLSAIGSPNIIILIAAYTSALIVRILTRLTLDRPCESIAENKSSDILLRLFSENVCLRMATACVSCFIVGIYILIQSGFLYYDLYGAIFGMICAPTAVFLYSGLYNDRVRHKISGGEQSKFYILAYAALAVSLSYAASDVYIYGISVASFGVMFLTMYVCRRYGIVRGMAIGTLCGLVCSVQLAPLFAFAALACGALWNISVFFASAAAFSVGIAWGLYAEGISALTGLMPAILAATLMFAVLDKLFFAEKFAAKTDEKSDAEAAENAASAKAAVICEVGTQSRLYEIRLEAAEQRVKALCEMYTSLSRLFYGLCDRMRRPALTDLRQICDSEFDACCAGCPNSQNCLSDGYESLAATIGAISTALHKNGVVTLEDIPVGFRERCERINDIICAVNHNSSLHARQLLQCDKTEILAFDYEATADMLAGIMSIENAEYECRTDMTEKLCDKLTALGVGIREAVAFGNRRRGIILRSDNPETFAKNGELIANAVSEICGSPVSVISTESDGTSSEARFGVTRKVGVSYARRAVRSVTEEEFCGDTINIFENNADCLYSFISDGMGSGRDAAFTSGLCSIFLQKLLSSGGKCDVALRMLNNFLRNKGSGSLHECSATVDLMELDMLMGKAAFYKSGAAPTYVFRDGNLFKLTAHTVPVGIIRELDAKKISFDVEKGDIIVMVSDGVTQGKEECPWLGEILRRATSDGLERTADAIVGKCLNEGDSTPDDVSVVVMRIE